MDKGKHITVGVAGHVDHGKTALVRALTGTETDRLKEEQARGMSIVLGFAHLALPGGVVDLIDVPGHEKFVRTMIAGATGLDAAMLVVAANERVRPQTVEHVALLGLLGVRRGLVVIGKSDLVTEPEERARTEAEVRAFVAPTFLGDSGVFWASAHTGEGLEQITKALAGLLAASDAPPEWPYLTLPVDRAFTIVGQGTIVTGTLRRASLRVGQAVEIWPRGLRAEVRGLEVHGQAVPIARPGWRTAVNLRGVKKEDVAHGDTLATTGALRPTRLLDAELSVLPSAERPIRRGQAVTLHWGTAEVAARVYPLGPLEIAPGASSPTQFRLAEDAVVPVGEAFVIRTPSPPETLGGGHIVDSYPAKHTRVDEGVLRSFAILAYGQPTDRLREKLREAGPAGRDRRELTLDLGLDADALTPDLAHFCGGLALDLDAFAAMTVQARDGVRAFHAKNPLRRGLPREELRRLLPRSLAPVALASLLESTAQAGLLETFAGLVRETGYNPEEALSAIERDIAGEIEARFRDGGLKPPDLNEVLKRDRRRKSVYQFLVEAGKLTPTVGGAEGRTAVFHQEAIAAATQRLQSASWGDGLSVSELDAILGTTRKFAIPLLEHLDALGITRRRGDRRVWGEAEIKDEKERPNDDTP
jgi:selenocysteine-specific elongation factor